VADNQWVTATTEEFAVWLRGDLGQVGSEILMEPQAEDAARKRLSWWRENRPDVQSVLLVRQVVRRPWAVAVRSGQAVS